MLYGGIGATAQEEYMTTLNITTQHSEPLELEKQALEQFTPIFYHTTDAAKAPICFRLTGVLLTDIRSEYGADTLPEECHDRLFNVDGKIHAPLSKKMLIPYIAVAGHVRLLLEQA